MAPDIALLRQFLARAAAPPPLLEEGLARNAPPSYAELAAVLKGADKVELALRLMAQSATPDGFTIEEPGLFPAVVWMAAIDRGVREQLLPNPTIPVAPLLDERNGMANRLPNAVRGAARKSPIEIRELFARCVADGKPLRSVSLMRDESAPEVSRWIKRLAGRCVAVDRVGSLELLCACAVTRVRYVASSLLDGEIVSRLRGHATVLGLDYDILGDESSCVLYNNGKV